VLGSARRIGGMSLDDDLNFPVVAAAGRRGAAVAELSARVAEHLGFHPADVERLRGLAPLCEHGTARLPRDITPDELQIIEFVDAFVGAGA
jgi:hypothetical protein